MTEVLKFDSFEEVTALPGSGVMPSIEVDKAGHGAAFHLAAIRNSSCVARGSGWIDRTPNLNNQPLGIVGHYAAVDLEAGMAVLAGAERELASRGFRTVVGPMDGNTWRRYRLLTRRGDEPPFFLEPDNPDDWPTHFSAAGFSPLSTYFSSLNDDLSKSDPRVSAILLRLAAIGVTIRPIRLDRFEEELRAIHTLSIEAFAENFLYTPISQKDFLSMYLPVLAHVRPELILLAKQADELIGFIFSVPDLLEPTRGQPSRTIIAKSMAVRPDHAGQGLGLVLMDRFQQAAQQVGFSRVIHALMHQDNRSFKISRRFGRPIREYTLYQKGIL